MDLGLYVCEWQKEWGADGEANEVIAGQVGVAGSAVKVLKAWICLANRFSFNIPKGEYSSSGEHKCAQHVLWQRVH